eukprot:165839_1
MTYRNSIFVDKQQWTILSIDSNTILQYEYACECLKILNTNLNVMRMTIDQYYTKKETIEIINTHEFAFDDCVIRSSVTPCTEYAPLIQLHKVSHEKGTCGLKGCNLNYKQFPFDYCRQCNGHFHLVHLSKKKWLQYPISVCPYCIQDNKAVLAANYNPNSEVECVNIINETDSDTLLIFRQCSTESLVVKCNEPLSDKECDAYNIYKFQFGSDIAKQMTIYYFEYDEKYNGLDIRTKVYKCHTDQMNGLVFDFHPILAKYNYLDTIKEVKAFITKTFFNHKQRNAVFGKFDDALSEPTAKGDGIVIFSSDYQMKSEAHDFSTMNDEEIRKKYGNIKTNLEDWEFFLRESDFKMNDPKTWNNCGWKQSYTDMINALQDHLLKIVEQITGTLLEFNCCDIVCNECGLYPSHCDYGMNTTEKKYDNHWYNNRFAPYFGMFQLFCQDKYVNLAMRRKEQTMHPKISMECQSYQAIFGHYKFASRFEHGIVSEYEYALFVWRRAILGRMLR